MANPKTGNFCLDNCNGACCRVGAKIVVYSKREYEIIGGDNTLQETDLYTPQGERSRIFIKNCQQLTENGKCRIYDDPARPQACQDSKPLKQLFCTEARKIHGLC